MRAAERIRRRHARKQEIRHLAKLRRRERVEDEDMGDRKYPVFKEVPEGWKVIEGAVNHPPGYRWIGNRKFRNKSVEWILFFGM